MACKRSPVRSRYSPPKSTVLRRKYGAFLFAEADFGGRHCFICTVFKKECLPPGFSAGCRIEVIRGHTVVSRAESNSGI